MTNDDSDAQILKNLFEKTLDEILQAKETELKLSQKEIESFRKAYAFLFALVYGSKWYTDQDELAQQVSDFISAAIGGD